MVLQHLNPSSSNFSRKEGKDASAKKSEVTCSPTCDSVGRERN
ncbi:hypothetical protein E2C01_016505 [Portunus trituberculatus]|uniref:Uncharacterized protein n=1 Tax=Portunus trituberculatus TaxID=210409 RepID=A0A5B7DRA4_PORTR|nr:hypothetical protein [Portunus trituberculatus]